jgi:CDP-diacylglycerol--glycerol-3-phosphate 3-phosphatidyltransferase
MVLNAYARPTTDRIVVPMARGLVRMGATANVLTTFGLIATFIGAATVVSGHHLAGALVLAFATATDALDGAVARLSGSVTSWGAFYDSVCDRISDVVLFGAAIWLVRTDPLMFVVALVAFGGALLTSYIRARAESLDYDATVGLLERPERVMILIAGMGLGFLLPALWVLAVGGILTVGQRMHAVMDQAAES